METEKKEGKSIHAIIRKLHGEVGYFVLGITIIYSLSGILLIFRDTDFLKNEKKQERVVSPNLNITELAKILKIKEIKNPTQTDSLLYFAGGYYNPETGFLSNSTSELPSLLSKMTELHKSSSKKTAHWFTMIFGVLLSFLAISSFWMFKPNSSSFKKGLILSIIGGISALLLFFID